jgi:hypothetical protein
MRSARRPILALSLALAACVSPIYVSSASAAGAEQTLSVPTTPDIAAVEFLLASAAKEFRSASSARPVSFRQVVVGYLSEAGQGSYILCGGFQSTESKPAEWIKFATIKTSDYEQWLGGLAESLCSSKKVKWYSGNHSATLMQKVRS